MSFALVALVITVVFDIERLALLHRIRADLVQGQSAVLFQDHRDAVTSDHRVAVGAWLRIGSEILAAVAFVVWFHRAYRNLFALGADSLRYETGWAIGAWFIPFVSFVAPKRVANDIWRGSEPEFDVYLQPDWFAEPPFFLNLWWAAWVIGGVLFGVAELHGGGGGSGESLSTLLTSTWIHLVASLISCVAAVLAIMVVRRLTTREIRRARALADRDTGAAGPAELAPSPA